jgi:FtsH-binding integral membrane protein
MVLMSLAAALTALKRRHDPLMRGMAFASIMGIIALLIHSTVDFNLQIPANAATFMVILALGWIALSLDRKIINTQEKN